jgi:hypothetical protein
MAAPPSICGCLGVCVALLTYSYLYKRGTQRQSLMTLQWNKRACSTRPPAYVRSSSQRGVLPFAALRRVEKTA